MATLIKSRTLSLGTATYPKTWRMGNCLQSNHDGSQQNIPTSHSPEAWINVTPKDQDKHEFFPQNILNPNSGESANEELTDKDSQLVIVPISLCPSE